MSLPVHVVDSLNLSWGLGWQVLEAARAAARGLSTAEVVDAVSAVRDRVQLIVGLDRLDNLAKGGRIGKAAAFAGNLLNVKPILTIRDGEVVPLKRVRGNQKAFHEFESLFESTSTDSGHLKVGIAHAAAPERLEALRKMVRALRPHAQIEMTTTLGAVVGTHAGPGTVGFFWFDDPD